MKLRRISKKGMDGSQLNWVFMLVAGVTILLFFFFVVQKQRSISRETLSEKILTNLQGLFIGASVSTGATNYFDTPSMRFDFVCRKDTCNEYGCGESSFSIPDYSNMKKTLSTQPLFSPNSLKGSSMTVITKPWNVPFKAINFVYITSPSIAYIVVYDDSDAKAKALAEEIHNELLPQEILEQNNKKRRLIVKYLYSSSNVGGSGDDQGMQTIKYEQVKVVFVGQATNDAVPWDGAIKANALQIASGSDVSKNGAMKFLSYDKNLKQWVADGGDSTSSYYVGLPSLLGAIYASDRDNYECNMAKAMAAFTQTSSLYEARRNALLADSQAAGNDACRLTYAQAGEKMKLILALKKTGQQIPIEDKTMRTIYDSGMNEDSPSLAFYNMRLERQSCSSIY